MAPLAPFVSEEIYRNLVCSVDPNAPDSVHLAEYPTADQDLVDQQLMDATRLAMRISSMGRGARSKAGIKVRQPLPRVVVKTRTAAETETLRQVESQVLDELNIKALEGVGQSDITEAAMARLSDESEGIVQLDQFWVSLEGGYMVAVDRTVTPELAEEGLARELVHRIQNLRRAAGFEVTDRIVTYYQAPQEIQQVMGGGFAGYIRQETLSEDLVAGTPPDGVKTETMKVEGREITLGVRRV
jgi:isoleucyl-tRNA synthetase